MNLEVISPGRFIARGRTADVYEWDAEHVIKLFHDEYDFESIEYEFKIVNAVCASGIRTPKAVELVYNESLHGLIYERAEGVPMGEMLWRKPWTIFEHARGLARLQKQMHAHPFDADVPCQHSRLQNKISRAAGLPASLKKSLLNELSTLPEGDRVCHGDLHPGNVLISKSGPVVLDWVDAAMGNPLADAARTSILLLGFAESDPTTKLAEKLSTRLFHTLYLHEYIKGNSSAKEEYLRWLPIVAAARLSEEIPELEAWLVKQAQKHQG